MSRSRDQSGRPAMKLLALASTRGYCESEGSMSPRLGLPEGVPQFRIHQQLTSRRTELGSFHATKNYPQAFVSRIKHGYSRKNQDHFQIVHMA